MGRCRICTANDEGALVEGVAQAMWNTFESRDPVTEWRPWERAGEFWQGKMRDFAAATIVALRKKHQS